MHKLNLSNSTISIPEGYVSALGDDARKYHFATQSLECDAVEAVVISRDFLHQIYFEFNDSGYISIDDWNDVDPDLLLASIKESTEEANVVRRKAGIGGLRTIGWIQPPVLDRDTNTVFSSIELYDEDMEALIVNARALRLGRKGYELVTWVTDKDTYNDSDGQLDLMLSSHNFDSGYRYTDYSIGDKMAGYSVATLVAATVGGKIAKTSGLLFVLKKFFGVIFAGIAGLFYKLKKWYKS